MNVKELTEIIFRQFPELSKAEAFEAATRSLSEPSFILNGKGEEDA